MNGEYPMPEPPGSPAEPAPERYPFWSYQDLVAVFLLALPSLLAGAFLVQALFWLAHWRPPGKAAQLLPAQFIGYGIWFLCLYLLLKVRYGRPFWQSLAWRRPPQGYAAGVLAGVMVALGVALLGALLRTPDVEMPMKELLSDRFSIVLVGVFAVTLGPLCEELAFRGFFLPLLIRSLGPLPGVFLAALPFALLHGPQYGWSWRHVLLITLAGAAFGWARHRSRSTAAAAVMHAAYNLFFFLAYVLHRKDVPL